eukprot:CAMPEP_0117449422 /NCGR_PEP_ID=MMETSP0759-20121206/7938_1 /TAXON_ID=63605 /ORGANISM="Percolomonas cosmopolitus, Strain WS" /LENGTH=323 /DNA_ID=CAMNT_0005241899 /DNA_START=301 /DNA_END=1272 /DNA_ORIENTATION=+
MLHFHLSLSESFSFSLFNSLGFQSSDAEHHFISSADEHHKISLQKKKKKFRKTQKDTNQRLILLDLPEGEEITEEYFKTLFRDEYESPFTEFATGKLTITPKEEKMMQKWMDSAMGTSENKENNTAHDETRNDFYSVRRWTPMMRYSRITNNIQSAFHRVYGKEHMTLFFADLESFLEDFITKQKPRQVIVFKDGYQRFLAHGVMRYYLLHSKSVDFKGQRMTVIQRSSRLKRLQAFAAKNPKKGAHLVLPKMRLYQYLSLLWKCSPQDIDRRVRNGETFQIQEDQIVSQLNVSDMESGLDSTGTRRSRSRKKKVLRKTQRGR